ncbi:MAG TPA: ATP-grasp domain-containing protein, partial [bacterium]
MARLHEYKGKELLRNGKIPTPNGVVCKSSEEVFKAAQKIGRPVVMKAQVWTTGRAGIGGIQFANTPAEAKRLSKKLFGLTVKNFVVDQVLVEEKLVIKQEFYTGIIIDDRERQPVIIFSAIGGTGIEEIAAQHPDKVAKAGIDIVEGFKEFQARNLIRKTG